MDNSTARATRNTRQKDILWSVFSSMKNHPTADMVFEAAKALYPRIGRATVYRALNSYLNEGLAMRVPVYDGADRFDISTFPHSHAKCKSCGTVEDIFSTPQIELPTPPLANGFTVEGGTVMYYGICKNCYENQKIK